MFSPAELEYLEQQYFPKPMAAAPVVEDYSIMDRIGNQSANIPSNALNSLIRSFVALPGLFSKDYREMVPVEGMAPVPTFYDIPNANTTGEKVTDFLLGGLAPELAAVMVPYVGINKLALASGMAPLASTALAQGVAGGFQATQYGPEHALLGGLSAGAGGALAGMGRLARIAPSAGISTLDFLGQSAIGLSPQQAGIVAGAGFLGNLFPGKMGRGADLARSTPEPLPPPFSNQNLDPVPPRKSAQDSAEAIAEAYRRDPQSTLFDLNRYPISRQAVLIDSPGPAIPNERQMMLDDLFLRQIDQTPNPIDSAPPGTLMLGDSVGQRNLFPLEQYSNNRQAVLVEDAPVKVDYSDPRQMTLDDLVLRKIENRRDDYRLDPSGQRQLFDLEDYPIRRDGVLVDPKKPSSPVDPRQMELDDLILRSIETPNRKWNVDDGTLFDLPARPYRAPELADPLAPKQQAYVDPRQMQLDDLFLRQLEQTKPVVKAQQAEIKPIAATISKVTKAKDFETTGTYEVEINGQKKRIFRDPDSKAWMDRDDLWLSNNNGYKVLGYTKKEALEKLQRLSAKANQPLSKQDEMIKALQANEGLIRSVAKGQGIPDDMLDDVVQEVSLVALRDADIFDAAKGNIQGFIAGRTKFKAIDILRKNMAERRDVRLNNSMDAPTLQGERTVAETISDGSITPDGKAGMNDMMDLLHSQMKGFSENERIILMDHANKVTVEETAKKLGKSKATISKSKTNLLSKLRKEMEKQGVTAEDVVFTSGKLDALKTNSRSDAGFAANELVESIGVGAGAGALDYYLTGNVDEAFAVGIGAMVGAGALRRMQTASPKKGSASLDYTKLSAENNAKYDGFHPDLKLHQFTLLDNGTTINLKEGLGADEVIQAITGKRQEFLDADSYDSVVNVFKTLKDMGLGEEFMTPSQQVTLRQGAPSMRLGAGLNTGGFVSNEAVSGLAGAAGGALVGGVSSGGEIDAMLGGALVGLGLGVVGFKAIKNLAEVKGPAATTAPSNPIPNATWKEKLLKFAKDTSYTPGGAAVTGRGGVWAGTVRGAEQWFDFNKPWDAKEAKILSEGFVSSIAGKLQDTIDSVKGIKASLPFLEKSSAFLKGQLVSEIDVRKTLQAGGAITQEAWKKLPATSRKHLTEKWVVKKDSTNTNTVGEGIEVFHATKATIDKLAAMEQQALMRAASSPVDQKFMALPLEARKQFNTMQATVIEALQHDSVQMNKVLGTMHQYSTRAFKIHSDPTFYPNEAQISKVMDEWKASRPQGPGGYSDMMARQDVETFLLEHRTNKEIHKSISKSGDMDASLFGQRKELTPAERALLGEYTNPTEEIIHTMNRLMPLAQSAKMIKLMAEGQTNTGLKLGYSNSDFMIEEVRLRNITNNSADPREVAKATELLAELKSSVVTKNDPRLGMFGEYRLSRFAYDQLKDQKSPWGVLENPVARSISLAHNFIKQSQTVFNPITQVRNVVTMPVFLAMGRATDPSSLKTAFEILKNKAHPMRDRMKSLGLFDASYVQGELKQSFHQLVNGEADSLITKGWNKFKNTMQNMYAAPDTFVKIATFLSAEARFAKKNPSWTSEQVKRAALKFTDERTMDYGNVPAAIKTARQVPLVNMYISYAYEIMRISKNMAVDTAGGDFQAGITLAAIGSIPFILQAAAEKDLTPEQRKRWESANKLSPDYSRSRFKIPTGREDAKGNMHYLDITPLNVVDNYAQMARSVVNGDWSSALASNPVFGWENTPLFAIMASQISGKNLRSHRDFRDLNDRFTAFTEQVIPPIIPGSYEMNRSLPESLGGNLGITNEKTGRTNTTEGLILRLLTGVNSSTVNPEILKGNAVKIFRRELANEKQYLNDVLKSTTSDERKQRAQKIFQESVKVHLMELVDKTQP